MTFYPLMAVRTDFSLGESIVGVDDLPKIMEAVDTKVVGITETMSVSSLVAATKKVSDIDGRVVTGVRIRVIMKDDSLDEEGKKTKKEDREEAAYLKLWPVNEQGMKCIYRILTRGFDEDRFYYVARVTWDDLHDLIEDDCLAITTDDTQSVLQREDMRKALGDLCAAKRFAASFYELVTSDTPYFSRQNELAIKWGRQNGFQPLTVMPTFWIEDATHAYSINASIAEKRPFEDYLRPVPKYEPHTQKQMAEAAKKAAVALTTRYGRTAGPLFAEGLRNQQRLIDTIKYRWEKQEPALPVVHTDPDAELTRMCKVGFKERFSKPMFGHTPTRDELATKYMPQLKFELDVLKRLGFAQYFLLVADMVRWSKEQGIYVGPGRGSIGGSLVAYLVGITDVDPIRFKLLFERFINPDRLDLPDADLDFMSTRRQEVVDYLEKRWGSDNVAGIVNYNTMGARSSIRDVARIFKIDARDLDATKFIGDEHGVSETLTQAHDATLEVREFASKLPHVWENALKLEGKMRAFGTHAAGIVPASCKLTERAVVERRGGSRVINWDKRVSEDQGLIKLDVLGLSTLDMFDRAIKLIFQRHSKKIDINRLPLDDAKTLDVFNDARTAGVFQFEGGSVRRFMKDMSKDRPLDFEDLVALNALNRPGPLDAGLTESYIKRRAGKEAVTYPHPSLQPILESTYGVIAYQEQVMQVARILCGFTPGEADSLRKAMGKKDPVMMAKQRDKFVDGADSVSNMDRAEAEALFDTIQGFAGYAFNRSHAVEYTLIGYQAAWLKAHYPVEFYCGTMGVAATDKLAVLAKKAKADGIDILPPDVNVSTQHFEPLNDTTIAAPLSAVKNVSVKGAAEIIRARENPNPVIVETSSGRGKKKVVTQTSYGPGPFKSIDDLANRVQRRLVNARAIEHLDKVGAFARIEPGQAPAQCGSRQKDQIELMPALADQGVSAKRNIEYSERTARHIMAIEAQMAEKLEGSPVPCYLGDDPKFMVILDAPFNDYEQLKSQFSYQKFVAPSLHAAGLTIDDAVWTWLLRRPLNKGESTPPAEEVAASLPFLKAEVASMKPPVIVLLGGQVARQFFPDLKRPNDNVGHKAYSAELDATVILGFKPTQIYHDPAKAEPLAEIFAEAKRLTDNIA